VEYVFVDFGKGRKPSVIGIVTLVAWIGYHNLHVSATFWLL
jgi:hypothetical protein